MFCFFFKLYGPFLWMEFNCLNVTCPGCSSNYAGKKEHHFYGRTEEHAYPNKTNKELGAIYENLSICSQ